MAYFFDVTSKCWIHKGINDRVGNIVHKIHIKYNAVVRNGAQSHEPSRKEGDDEDNSDDEQHQSRFYVCYCIVIPVVIVVVVVVMVVVL